MNSSGPIPALRGYRLQFLYTLLRILKGSEIETIHPESLEDYSVSVAMKLTEVVQVKNYGEPLRLSDLSPGNEKGFVRRSVTHLLEAPDVTWKLVVLGDLGPELMGLQATKASKSIQRKLTNNYGFSASEANIFTSRLEIIQIQADEIRQLVESIIAKSIAGVDVIIATDMLLYWMYQLAEGQESVTRSDLVRKTERVGQFINERGGFLAEFGASILPLGNSTLTIGEKEKDDFQSGIAARYSHIESGLDVLRPDKMAALDRAFDRDKVVIVHGASGQGKSTLAYRYAYERYPRGYAFEISSAAGANRILDIARAVKALSQPFATPFLMLIDVAPGTTHWVNLCRQLSEREYCQLLVTIREEDLSRAGGVGEYFSVTDVSLHFTQAEAAQLFGSLKVQTPIPHFLNFTDAWSQFGGEGPLLEFMFLLRQGEKLRERLGNQLQRIQGRVAAEGDDNEVKLLRLVAIAGAYDCRLDLQRLLKAVPLRNPQRALRHFQEEYLLREGEGGAYLEALHPVRARIMAELLCDSDVAPVQEAFAFCQPLVLEEDWGNYILQYGYHFGWDEVIMSSSLYLRPRRWKTCREMHRALVWCGVWAYIEENKNALNELKSEFSDAFDFCLMRVVIPHVDLSVVLSTWPSERRQLLDSLVSNFTGVERFYRFSRGWAGNVSLPKELHHSMGPEISAFGYMHFWLNEYGIDYPLMQSEVSAVHAIQVESHTLEDLADLLAGITFNKTSFGSLGFLASSFLRLLQKREGVVKVENDQEQIKLHFAYTMAEGEFTDGFGAKPMRLLRLLRKAFPLHSGYGTQGYGHKFRIIPLSFDDSLKQIAASSLPISWLTEANGVFLNLMDWDRRKKNWDELASELIYTQRSILEGLRRCLNGLERIAKKNKIKNVKQLDLNSARFNLEIRLPQSASDPFGFSGDTLSKGTDPALHGRPVIQMIDPFIEASTKGIKDFYRPISNFFWQADRVLQLMEASQSWTKEDWESKKELLDKKGYSVNNYRVSKYNLSEASVNLRGFQVGMRYFSGQSLLSLERREQGLEEILGTLSLVWNYFVDYRPNKVKGLSGLVARKAETVIEQFSDKLEANLAEFVEGKIIEDYELVYSSEWNGVCYVIFYVGGYIDGAICTDRFYDLIKKSIPESSPNTFVRSVLDRALREIWAVPLVKDFLLSKTAYSLNAHITLDRNKEVSFKTQTLELPELVMKELEVTYAGDVYPEFENVERFNRLYNLIRQSFEHTRQVVEAPRDRQIGTKVVYAVVEKIALAVGEYADQQEPLVLQLTDMIVAELEKEQPFIPDGRFVSSSRQLLEPFLLVDKFLESIEASGVSEEVLRQVLAIDEKFQEVGEAQGIVYGCWKDLLVENFLKPNLG